MRDVSIGEDAYRVRAGAAPQALAAVRNSVISPVRLAGGTNVAAALRRFAAKPAKPLAAIGIPSQQIKRPWRVTEECC